MRILVPVKFVPDPTGEAAFTSGHTLVRTAANGQLSELDEYALEQALQLAPALGAGITALSIGPQAAETALRKALQIGADDAVLISDDAIAGSDVFGTAAVLAAAVRTLGDVGLVLCGMGSTDSGTGVLPVLVADQLGWPWLSQASQIAADADGVRITRVDEHGTRLVRAPLPAVASVTDQTGEPRYPSFKDVLAAKKKPLTTLTLADLAVSSELVGAGAARVQVTQIVRNPPRAAGRVLTGTGADTVDELVAFLTAAN